MDITSPRDIPVSEDSGLFGGFPTNHCQVARIDCGNLHVNDLGSRFTNVLTIQDEQTSTYVESQCSDGKVYSNGGMIDNCKELPRVKSDNFYSGKSLSICATFPCSTKGKSLLSAMFDGKPDSDVGLSAQDLSPADHTQSENCPYSRSFSLPTYSKIVSAMKGSREKSGVPPPKKLSVSWAPDVYDPLPTSVSHLPSRSQRYRSNNRRNGKNKQKGGGKGARGTRGKEKKKSRKYSGYSSTTFDDLDEDFGETESGNVDYASVKPDPFCGHSFLKSVTAMHFPVAEAT